MDVILLKDVERLGSSGAVVVVKPGFARNYLIPSGLAAPANAQRLAAVQAQQRQHQQQAQRLKGEAEALKRAIDGRPITLTLKIGEGDKPFGSITAHDLVAALQRQEILVEKQAIQLEQPIKTLGAHAVPIRLQADVIATLHVTVVTEVP